ncbi:MAG: hypothetical protein AAF503_00590 [Pseudomonadota bacterium]
MCFSANASFTAAAVLGVAGSITMATALRKNLSRGECLMASFPLVFALQQAAEGVVWLGITGDIAPWLMALGTYSFVFAAYVFWPVMDPLLGWMLEPTGLRRGIFAVLIAGGAGIAAYLAYAAISMPQTPMAMPEWGGAFVVHA